MASEIFAQRITSSARCPSISKAPQIIRALRSRPSTQRQLSSACLSNGTQIPEFLLPAFTSNRTSALRPIHNYTRTSLIPCPQTRRAFSSTSRAQAAVITTNPRKDENGIDMVVDITPRAANVICSIHSFYRYRLLTVSDSALKRSCPKIPIPTSPFESQSNPEVAMAFSISCLLQTHPTFTEMKIQYLKQAMVPAQEW